MQKLFRNVCKVLSVFLLIVFLGFSAAAGTRLYDTWKTRHTVNQLAELRLMAQEEKDWSKGMLAVNPDYVGWLTVYGTTADGPVVQGEDNNEYLRTDIYGEHATAGTLFMDSIVDMDSGGNLIIYGHHMQDDTMFGEFDKYRNKKFMEENNIVRWEDKTGTHIFRLFGAMIISGSSTDTDYVNLQQWANKPGAQETRSMLQILKEKCFLYQDDLFRDPNGRYLFLVTCDERFWNGRIVLIGEELDGDSTILVPKDTETHETTQSSQPSESAEKAE